MSREKMIILFRVIIPLIIAVCSFTVITDYSTSKKVHEKTLNSLDEKKKTVLELSGGATAASVAITLVPGDAGTPIAEKLADLSGYFLIVFSAIYLEKYLVTVMGFAAFKILIPVACVLIAANTFMRRRQFDELAAKLAVFGIVIYLIIPTSIMVSDFIDEKYSESMNMTIESAKNSTEDIETEEEDTDSGWWDGIVSKVENKVDETIQKFEDILNKMIEALAILIVTSCLIPIAVIIFFLWVSKIIFGIDYDLKNVNPPRGSEALKYIKQEREN